MSKKALDWVWTQSASKGTARVVLLALAREATGSHLAVCAGSTWLMEQANASRNSVLTALRTLEASGEIAEVEGVLGHLSHPVWILPKAIFHTLSIPGARDDGRKSVRLTIAELSECDDPESDLYWMAEDKVQSLVTQRIAECVAKNTQPGVPSS
ncbi:hypothetical protein [Streptomyces sp. NPDC091294]|uniref:hypothetical protein n=1 Tax=Streptomyces sp. NPDC091294 TaxID=3365992 RepID=UPI00380AB5F1